MEKHSKIPNFIRFSSVYTLVKSGAFSSERSEELKAESPHRSARADLQRATEGRPLEKSARADLHG